MGNIIITPSIPIILASASKIRYEILRKAGLEFSVIISDVDEEKLKKKIVNKSIKEKALNVSITNPNSYVIGADQICNLNDKIFSKPKNINNAIEQLKELSGKTHKQTSGISLCFNGKIIWSCVEEAELTMNELEENEIIKYLEIDKPFNSCGSYRYESHGIHLFSKVTGNNETIQGLPLIALLKQFRENKIYSIKKFKV